MEGSGFFSRPSILDRFQVGRNKKVKQDDPVVRRVKRVQYTSLPTPERTREFVEGRHALYREKRAEIKFGKDLKSFLQAEKFADDLREKGKNIPLPAPHPSMLPPFVE